MMYAAIACHEELYSSSTTVNWQFYIFIDEFHIEHFICCGTSARQVSSCFHLLHYWELAKNKELHPKDFSRLEYLKFKLYL